MSNDIDPIPKIDSYLQGDLTSAEVADFEKQLNLDHSLQEDLTSTKRVIEGIKGYAFKQNLISIHKEYLANKRVKTTQLYYFLGIAASLAFILIAYFYLSPTPSIKYYSYFKPYPGPVNVRNGNESDASRAAFEHYERGEFREALADFEKLSPEAQTEEIRFYKAVSYLTQHHPKAALEILSNLNGEKYQTQTNWYLSLSYLLINEREKATVVLNKIQPGDYNFEQAQEILSQLMN